MEIRTKILEQLFLPSFVIYGRFCCLKAPKPYNDDPYIQIKEMITFLQLVWVVVVHGFLFLFAVASVDRQTFCYDKSSTGKMTRKTSLRASSSGVATVSVCL